MAALTRLVRWLVPTLLAATPLAAQQQHTLVLSGGGARGLAHGGVLVGLEQLGYRVPTVVGTSMGAVVGALFAAGYSPADIRDIIAQQNWADLFAADPFPVGPDRQPRRPMLTVGVAHGGELEGFVAQAAINRRLVQLLFDAGARANNDFDALPRRFRAITADLRTGRQVVLAGGDLARAVRASMAVPGVFAPVRRGELVLVDGGLANNLGISVAQALDTAPIIAVDVLRPDAAIEDSSAVGVGLRALRLLLLNARGGRDTAEHFVVPRIPPEFTEATFPADALPLLRAGHAAALAQLPPAEPATVADARAPAVRAAPDVLTRIRVEGVGDGLAGLVRRTFASALGPYDPERVLARADALYATGMFHGVWPRVERAPGAGDGELVVMAEPIARVVATGAVRWDNDTGAGAWAALRTRVRLPAPAELRASANLERLDRSASASATFLHGISPPWALSVGGHWVERQVRQFDDEHAITAQPDVRRAGAWLALEWRSLRPQQALAFAFRAEDVRAQAGPDGASIGPYVRFGAFPATHPLIGTENLLEGEFRVGDNRYARLHASGSAAARWRRARIALVGSATSVRGAAPLDVLPALGGLQRLPWLRVGEVRAAAAVIGGADVAWPLLSSLDARVRLRTGAAAGAIDELSAAPWRSGGELAAVWRTALAPVTVGVAGGSTAGGAEWRINLAVGAGW